MNRLRIPVIALCTLAIATVATAASLMPRAKGVGASTVTAQATAATDSAGPYAPTRSMYDDAWFDGVADERVTGRSNPHCDPCTLICPVGRKVLQNGHCECRCVNGPHD